MHDAEVYTVELSPPMRRLVSIISRRNEWSPAEIMTRALLCLWGTVPAILSSEADIERLITELGDAVHRATPTS